MKASSLLFAALLPFAVNATSEDNESNKAKLKKLARNLRKSSVVANKKRGLFSVPHGKTAQAGKQQRPSSNLGNLKSKLASLNEAEHHAWINDHNKQLGEKRHDAPESLFHHKQQKESHRHLFQLGEGQRRQMFEHKRRNRHLTLEERREKFLSMQQVEAPRDYVPHGDRHLFASVFN